VILLLAAWSASAAAFFFARGYTLYYGDAEAHLNIARRIVDSRTPRSEQIGSVWLPLPHLLMAPLAASVTLWKSGLAGVIPSAICFVIAGGFLFAAARLVFGSDAAGVVALGLFALNPNVMYLQSIPMSEPVFWAAEMGMLYFTVRFCGSPKIGVRQPFSAKEPRKTESDTNFLGAVIGAGLACLAGTLSRYDGWFLVPFVTLFFFLSAPRRRMRVALIVGAIAALGPLAWLAHNWYWFGDPLYFLRGPSSAAGIQRGRAYPGYGDWKTAVIFYQSAAAWCAGPALRWIGGLGLVAAFARKAFWPLLFLALPVIFYLWNIHSGDSPIYVPNLWYGSYYNTRYGLAVIPLAAFASAALVTWTPPGARGWAAFVLIAAAGLPWLLHPTPERWITWKESQVNSEDRREWTRRTAAFLSPRYRRGEGVFTTFGDPTGIYRTMGLPLHETLTWDNDPQWMVTLRRPDLFLWEEWAVCVAGDPVQRTIHRARRAGLFYKLVDTIVVRDAPPIEIYRRSSRHENPVHQGARRP